MDDCLLYKVNDVSNNDGLIWLSQRQIVNLDDEIWWWHWCPCSNWQHFKTRAIFNVLPTWNQFFIWGTMEIQTAFPHKAFTAKTIQGWWFRTDLSKKKLKQRNLRQHQPQLSTSLYISNIKNICRDINIDFNSTYKSRFYSHETSMISYCKYGMC